MPMLLRDDPRAEDFGQRQFNKGYWLGIFTASATIVITRVIVAIF